MKKNFCTRLRALEQVMTSKRRSATQTAGVDAAESIRARLMSRAIRHGEIAPACDSGVSIRELRTEIAAIRAPKVADDNDA